VKQYGLTMAVCVLAALASPAWSVTELRRGDPAPAWSLKNLEGEAVKLEAMRDRIVVLVFGELFHDRSLQACRELEPIVRDLRLGGQNVEALLIVAQEAQAQDLRRRAVDAGVRFGVLHDPARQAFGAYQVAVMPSIVVIDKQGRIVHAVAGLLGRWADLVRDSLRYAAGQITAEQFGALFAAHPATAPSDNQVRAQRIAQLAKQLARRGMDDAAMEKYAEAIKLDADPPAPHVELGILHLKHRRLAAAEAEFRVVLNDRPAFTEALLGIAFVQVQRGGAELGLAERTVRGVLAANPSLPRAHYLLGLVQEQQGKAEDAAASFKKAAQFLLERTEPE